MWATAAEEEYTLTCTCAAFRKLFTVNRIVSSYRSKFFLSVHLKRIRREHCALATRQIVRFPPLAYS